MDLREGSRRLSLLFGASGVLFTALVFSYPDWNELWSLHQEFLSQVELADAPISVPEHLIRHPDGEVLISGERYKEVPASVRRRKVERSQSGEIVGIEFNNTSTDNGLSGAYMLRRADLPGILRFSRGLLYLIPGFLVPWAATRILFWVLVGFVSGRGGD